MAEIVGLAASAAQLLDQAIGLLGRIRKAHQRKQALPGILAHHEDELESLGGIIELIKAEKDLQTANVGLELTRLREVQDRLLRLLDELRPKYKNSVYQFAHQMAKGSTDESRLSCIMNELAQVKDMLLLRIQVASVGVMRDVKEGLVANTEVITRVDQTLRAAVENCEGLKIARLLHGRRPSNDGTIPLTSADLKSLRDAANDEDSEDETLVDDSDSSTSFDNKKQLSTERIVLRNMAKDQALQINAAVGKDIWKDIARTVIKDNVASNDATQINYSNTLEVTLALMKCNNEMRIALRQETPTHKRRDSVLD